MKQCSCKVLSFSLSGLPHTIHFVPFVYRITDSLDDDIPVVPAMPKKKKIPPSTEKPTIKDLLFDDAESDNNAAVALMGTNDVLDYIKQNQNTTADDDDDDLSLF